MGRKGCGCWAFGGRPRPRRVFASRLMAEGTNLKSNVLRFLPRDREGRHYRPMCRLSCFSSAPGHIDRPAIDCKTGLPALHADRKIPPILSGAPGSSQDAVGHSAGHRHREALIDTGLLADAVVCNQRFVPDAWGIGLRWAKRRFRGLAIGLSFLLTRRLGPPLPRPEFDASLSPTNRLLGAHVRDDGRVEETMEPQLFRRIATAVLVAGAALTGIGSATAQDTIKIAYTDPLSGP